MNVQIILGDTAKSGVKKVRLFFKLRLTSRRCQEHVDDGAEVNWHILGWRL